MSAVQMILTSAGAAEIAQASQLGPVVIEAVALGNQQWSPTVGATALQNEVKRVDTIDGGTSGATIRLTLTDESTSVYDVRELGLYSATGTLIAVWSGPTIATKGADTTLFLAVDVAITSIPGDANITVGATSFGLPAATESTAGIARLATRAEATSGAGTGLIIAPYYAADRNADNGFLQSQINALVARTTALETVVNGLELGFDYRTVDSTQRTFPRTYSGVFTIPRGPGFTVRAAFVVFTVVHQSAEMIAQFQCSGPSNSRIYYASKGSGYWQTSQMFFRINPTVSYENYNWSLELTASAEPSGTRIASIEYALVRGFPS